jgi:hypothetical protein
MTASLLEARDAALRRGDELWERLSAGLDASIDRPLSASSEWTGADVYNHFARWQAQTIADVRRIMAGQNPQPVEGTEDEINNRWREQDRALPPAVAREHCLATRDELRALLASLTAEQWDRFGRACASDVDGDHYEGHLRAISEGAHP